MDSIQRVQRAVLASAIGLLTVPAAQAQFATTVVDYSPGPLGAGEISITDNILGGPVGGGLSSGSTDILSLGEGGSVTVGFDVTITNGPGVDFSVFENAIVFGDVFAEVFLVEVSTDGTNFARFPTSYVGPQAPADFVLMPIGTYDGFGGHQPVLTNVFSNSIDPFNPAHSGGESFDLAALVNDPLVLGGQVDLEAIHFVRLTDVPTDGSTTDTNGANVYDSRNDAGAFNSADVDAIAVIQHTGTVSVNQPTIDLFIDGAGHLNLMMVDPDDNLDITTFRGSFKLLRANRFRLANLFTDTTDVPGGRIWRTSFPVAGNLMGSLAISISDMDGNFTADQIFLQG
jgi:hypothetical protein